jgi:hypothetical protein
VRQNGYGQNGEPMPRRTFEAAIEAIYEAYVMEPGWLIEPSSHTCFALPARFPIPITRSA